MLFLVKNNVLFISCFRKRGTIFDILGYKKLGLLVNLFNEINEKETIPVVQFAAIFLPAISIFLSIKWVAEIPWILLLFNILVILNALVFQLIVFSLAGQIHSLSSQTIKKWTTAIGNQRNKLIKRQLHSCPSFKIKFGSCTYMEKSTCLLSIQFTTNLVANMLLTTRK